MGTPRLDCVIVGGGAVGTAAAYHLARRKARTRLVEQFRIGHDRGSSHGASRIIRYSYAEIAYARLMSVAYEAWRELEEDAGESVYTRTGGVSLCPPELDYVARVAACLKALGVGHRRMRGADLRRTAPPFEVPDDEDVVFEPEIGILSAGRIVRLQVELAARHGGPRFSVDEMSRVERLDLAGEWPAVELAGERVEARRLIVTAGAWVPRLIPDLGRPLEVTRQFVAYLRPEPAGPYAIGRFPVFIRKLEAEQEAFYGLPDYAGTGVKVALHHAGRRVDPDEVDREVSAAELGRLRECLGACLPGLVPAPIERMETCLYTTTPDEGFIVGPLPGRADVIVASACSGHGFKFSNVVGRVLADLALDGQTDLEIEAWTLPF